MTWGMINHRAGALAGLCVLVMAAATQFSTFSLVRAVVVEDDPARDVQQAEQDGNDPAESRDVSWLVSQMADVSPREWLAMVAGLIAREMHAPTVDGLHVAFGEVTWDAKAGVLRIKGRDGTPAVRLRDERAGRPIRSLLLDDVEIVADDAELTLRAHVTLEPPDPPIEIFGNNRFPFELRITPGDLKMGWKIEGMTPAQGTFHITELKAVQPAE